VQYLSSLTSAVPSGAALAFRARDPAFA